MIHLSEHVKLAELKTQQVLAEYLFRRSDEIYTTLILCKFITFVSNFMLQTLYFHVFRRIPGEFLFCFSVK